jgi:hypothetical protein
MKNRIAAIGLAAVVVTSGGLAVAGSSALAASDNTKQQGGQSAEAGSQTTRGVIKCDGGKNLSMRSRIMDVPFTFVETATNAEDQAVPGAGLLVKGPSRGTDTLLITFSAETRVNGGNTDDWMGLEVHLDGSPIEPHSVGNPLAITAEPSWNGNSLQFCTKVGKGDHRLQAHANLFDSFGDHTMDGWLDDYTFSVLRFA